MIKALGLSVLLLLTALACGSQSPTEPGRPRTPAELRATPTTVDAAGSRLVLEASLWRDFMPISPPDGKPLTAVVKVHTTTGSPVPADLRATHLWVIFGEDVWSAVPREERPRAETAPDFEVVARDGPKWGPDVAVDVVVRLTDGTRSWFLRAADQRIAKTS